MQPSLLLVATPLAYKPPLRKQKDPTMTRRRDSGGRLFGAPLDREKLRAALRRLPRRTLFEVLDRAIDAVPRNRLAEVAGEHVPVAKLLPEEDLVAEVKKFCGASRRREYYESFDVNWKNSTQKSPGTETWIAECERLFRECVKRFNALGPGATRGGLGLLFDLLRDVDRGDEIVFWADEGGSDEVYMEEKKLLPVWFRCLAATASPEDYAREARAAIRDFGAYDRKRFVKPARSAANREQRAAFDALGES